MTTKVHTFKRNFDAEDGTPEHWETDIWCKDGSVVIGYGKTSDESVENAQKSADAHHAFLDSSPRERLKKILKRAKPPEHLLAVDVTHAIRALAEIVLGEEKAHEKG